MDRGSALLGYSSFAEPVQMSGSSDNGSTRTPGVPSRGTILNVYVTPGVAVFAVKSVEPVTVTRAAAGRALQIGAGTGSGLYSYLPPGPMTVGPSPVRSPPEKGRGKQDSA
jgi:hypothetical protein